MKKLFYITLLLALSTLLLSASVWRYSYKRAGKVHEVLDSRRSVLLLDMTINRRGKKQPKVEIDMDSRLVLVRTAVRMINPFSYNEVRYPYARVIARLKPYDVEKLPLVHLRTLSDAYAGRIKKGMTVYLLQESSPVDLISEIDNTTLPAGADGAITNSPSTNE